jgi:septin family protein
MATADVQEIRATSYVGFDSITQQIEHKLLKRGFQFNVIVVGTSCAPVSLSCASAILRGKAISNPSGFGY